MWIAVVPKNAIALREGKQAISISSIRSDDECREENEDAKDVPMCRSLEQAGHYTHQYTYVTNHEFENFTNSFKRPT